MVYVIITMTTLSALLFHFFLHRMIKRWVEQDYIRSLCNDCEDKLRFLMAEYATVSGRRLKHPKFELHFSELAVRYDTQKSNNQ